MMTSKIKNGAGNALADHAAVALVGVPVENPVRRSGGPIDAALHVAGDKHESEPDAWRHHHGVARRAEQGLARSRKIDILRQGGGIEPAGPPEAIRLPLCRSAAPDLEKA